MPALILAAPSSGAGKTTITLGILRALKNQGLPIASAKSGPDYIDPQFHAAATGAPCVNLDAWAMTPDRIQTLAASETPLLIEGAMGLFDGAPPVGKGATADLAKILHLPVVLIVDAKAMSHSIAALVHGFANHDPDVRIKGVILNNVGSERHADMLRAALTVLDIPVLGAVPRIDALSRPSRHLGLVQAGEMQDLEIFLNAAADLIARHIDLSALRSLMQAMPAAQNAPKLTSAPRSIAIAKDAAFSFIYPHYIADLEAAGTDIQYFSPLADDPVPKAQQVFLPGGYPELYATELAANRTFLDSLKNAAQSSDIYGECGGYMTLGETLIDADGTPHKMAGLLGLTTSFAARKRHLGYRILTPFYTDGESDTVTTAHEFHYATTLDAQGTPAYHAWDAAGADLGPVGLTQGRVSGSFMHCIDQMSRDKAFASLPRGA